MIVVDAEDAQYAASEDNSTQVDIISEVENWETEDANAGNYDDLEGDEDIIEDALDQEEIDKDIMVAAENEIATAYLAAELIDDANLQAVAGVISDTWIMEVN